ncbi:MAG: hypothetical protein KUG79_13985 [Pseudomonadales bacterium]|nr:hypothetical protein [Pseudomonadales bacterium]
MKMIFRILATTTISFFLTNVTYAVQSSPTLTISSVRIAETGNIILSYPQAWGTGCGDNHSLEIANLDNNKSELLTLVLSAFMTNKNVSFTYTYTCGTDGMMVSGMTIID